MREIKFRGKRIDNGEWVHGDLLHERYGICIQYIVNKYPTGAGAPERKPLTERHKVTVDPATVGQYTGLNDCKRTEEYPKGQKIHEGDITHVRETTCTPEETLEFIAPVVYDEGRFGFRDGTDGFIGLVICSTKEIAAKVLGNIHDNPELLEEG